MSGIFMSDPRWTYEDPSGVPEGPAGRAPGQVRVVRRSPRARGFRPVPSPRPAS